MFYIYMSGIYNYHIKVNNPNLSNDIPPMMDEASQPRFYFGGSQIPLGIGKPLNISGSGIKNKSKTKNHSQSKKAQKTEVDESSKIMLPRHLNIK